MSTLVYFYDSYSHDYICDKTGRCGLYLDPVDCANYLTSEINETSDINLTSEIFNAQNDKRINLFF